MKPDRSQCPTILGLGAIGECTPVNLFDAAHSRQCHRDVEFHADQLKRFGDARFAAGTEAIDIGTAEKAGAGAER